MSADGDPCFADVFLEFHNTNYSLKFEFVSLYSPFSTQPLVYGFHGIVESNMM